MITEELQKLYQSYTGVPAENITELPSSGSNRRYFRLTGTQTLIGVYGTSVDENEAFFYMAEHFRKNGLPVPEVHIVSEDKMYYLQEDLGDTLLFMSLRKDVLPVYFPKKRKSCFVKRSVCCLPFSLPELTDLIFPLLSPIGIQSAFHTLGFELFQILFP